LKEKIAKFRGFSIQKEQIFLGVGSDEAIDLLFRIFCNPVIDNVIVTPPTYGMYKVCAKVNDVSVKSAPLTSSFDLDIEGTLSLIDNNTKLIFICSPGNPSCKVIPNSEVEKVLTKFKTGIVVVDEAYIDFSSSVSACALLSKYPNVVVLQTLSKAFGLAGIRLGMLIGKQDVVQLFNNVKAPYNINKLTAEVANAVFDDPVALQSYTTNVSILMQERDFLLQEMKKIKVIKKIHHTDANFILFVVEKAQQIYKTMADRGVVCRYRFLLLFLLFLVIVLCLALFLVLQ
jgi:histidinol-phosphate aminotransferase